MDRNNKWNCSTFLCRLSSVRERHGEVEQINVQRRRRNKSFIGFKSERMPLEIDVIHIYVCCYTLRNGLILPVRIELLFEAGERLSFVYRRTREICPCSRVEHTHIHIRNINHFERLSVTCRVRSIQFNKRRKSHTIRLKTKTEQTNKQKNEWDGREIIKRRVKVLSAKRRRRTGEKSKKFYQ